MPPPQPAPPPAPAPAPAPPQPPKRWLFADVQNTVAKPPFPVPGRGSEEGGSLRDDTPAGEGLIRPARREKPLDPTRVLYRSQVITGMLLHAVSSDIPGQVRIMVTQPVTDKLHRGQVLIPQGSIVLGVQERTPAYGQNRLAVRIDEVHAPDGEVLALPGQLADRSGATGAKGKVNHHFARIGVAAVVSAALSIGARGIAGNPTGFQPSIGQEIARETGQSISRSGQSIVERTLDIPPTITLKAGTPVTIQLSENLSLQQPAAITP
jgi:type IV secretory pathway VirB10-like protein